MFGQYKRLKNVYEGVLTGKGLTYGGSGENRGYRLWSFISDKRIVEIKRN